MPKGGSGDIFGGLGAVFDGTLEGLLSVVFEKYQRKLDFQRVCPEEAFQQAIGAEYMYIQTDYAHARRVMDGIAKNISREAESNVYHAFMAADEAKYQAVYEYILLGFTVGADVDRHMELDCVLTTQKLSRYVQREAHLLKGFCRFAQTSSGVYYAAITPVNYPLPILAEHFIDRLGNQAWIIHDKKHGLAAVYDGNEYVIDKVPRRVNVELSDEEMYRELWKAFHTAISNGARKNYKQQRTMLPVRYRENMSEFIETGKDGHEDAKIIKPTLPKYDEI